MSLIPPVEKAVKAPSNALGDASQKSEDNLAMAEAELDKQTGLVSELTHKVDDLQVTADLAARLKDQVDECVVLTHVAGRLAECALGIAMRQTSSKRPRTSWKSIKRNSRKVPIYGSMLKSVGPAHASARPSHM